MKVSEKQLILSFHDLHPGSWESCRRFMKRCSDLGIAKMTLLLVPQFHGDPPFKENPDFLEWLKALNHDHIDLCLHGYYHQADQVSGGLIQQLKGRVYTTGEGEFYQLSQEQASLKLQRGLQMILSEKLPVYGFTAPAWLVSPGSKTAIKENGFLYNTYLDGVELPQTNLYMKIPTLVYSSRNLWRRWVSKRWVTFFHALNRKKPILRIAVHPIDFNYPDIEIHLMRVIKKALQTRTPSTYRDLIPAEMQTPISPAAGLAQL